MKIEAREMTLYQKLRLLFTLHTKTRDALREKFNTKNYIKSQSQLYKKLKLPKYDFKSLPKSVLVIEPNPYHGEILPGFVKYFQDLGYNVDIFMRLENYLENPFVRYTNNPPRMFFGTASVIRDWVNSLHGDEYEYVFLSSSAFWNMPEYYGAYLDFLGQEPKSRHGLILIEHNTNPCLVEYNELDLLKSGRVFALLKHDNVPMLNPHYFGPIINHRLNKKTIEFVAVGIRGSLSEEMLTKTTKYLIDNGYKNFVIKIIGKGTLEIPQDLEKYIRFLGRLNYKEMFDTVNNADFLLALLDSGNPVFDRFLTKSAVTGSLQLSLGFNIPMIIEKAFADLYDLNDTNAILYKKNELYSAMKNTLDMPHEKYNKMKNNLANLSTKIYQESKVNLSKAMEK